MYIYKQMFNSFVYFFSRYSIPYRVKFTKYVSSAS